MTIEGMRDLTLEVAVKEWWDAKNEMEVWSRTLGPFDPDPFNDSCRRWVTAERRLIELAKELGK